MDKKESLVCQITVALKECRNRYYSSEIVKYTLDLLEELHDLTTDESERTYILETYKGLCDKRNEVVERENRLKEELNKSKDDKLEDICPLIPNDKINELVFSDTRKLKSRFDSANKDNSLIICGPFEGDLFGTSESFVKRSGSDLRVFDIKKFIGENASDISSAMALLAEHCRTSVEDASACRETIIYRNLELLREDKDSENVFCFYLRLIRQTENKVRQLLLVSDPTYRFDEIYSEITKPKTGPVDREAYLKDADFPLDSISFVYLQLPSYSGTKSFIFDSFGISDDDRESAEFIRDNCYLLGYEGISSLVSECNSLNWRDYASKKCDEKRGIFKNFIDKIPECNITDIINCDFQEWNLSFGKKKTIKYISNNNYKPEKIKYKLHDDYYDYDASDDIAEIRERVIGVLNMENDADGNPISVMAKCGLVLRYAITNDDSMRNLSNLADDELEGTLIARWHIAYSALTQLMKIPYGELKFDIGDGEGFAGLCCDGGKVIRFLKKYFLTKNEKDIGYGCEVMLHESYHALQHAACDSVSDDGLLNYYFYNFGVSRSRVEYWKENFDYYASPSSKDMNSRNARFHTYHCQSVEVDANTFARDAWLEGEAIKINFNERGEND